MLSLLRAVMAALSWDMGCRLVGKLSSMVTTWEGSAARRAHSRDSQVTCGGHGGAEPWGRGPASPPPQAPRLLPAPGWAPLPSPAARKAPRAAAPLPPWLWAAASGTRGCCTRGSGCPKEPGTCVSRCGVTHARWVPAQGRIRPYLIRIQHGGLVHQPLHAPHPSVHLEKGRRGQSPAAAQPGDPGTAPASPHSPCPQ